MNPLLFVSFRYRKTAGGRWIFGKHKILHEAPVCDQPYIVHIEHIEELLKNTYSAHEVKLLHWQRFENI